MRPIHEAQSWVVYEWTHKGQPSGNNVVCEQADWDVLEGNFPGVHTLLKTGITSEAEAERFAREGMVALKNVPRKYR